MADFLRQIILFPFAIIYALAVNIRNFLFDKGLMRGVEFDVPIISVGNLSAGGNGKTPQVEYIIHLLLKDYNVAVLSRGYGRKSKGFHEVKVSDTPSFSGDEPLQIKRGFGDQIRMFVGEDRVEALTQIFFQYPDIQVVILDDAFQHRAVKPGLNLLLSDYAKPFFMDWYLPLGRLRESKSGAKRADAIILTKVPEQGSSLSEYREMASQYSSQIFASQWAYGDLQKLQGSKSIDFPSSFFLVTGIANPQSMEQYVSKHFELVDSMHFSDHHKFSRADLQKIAEKLSTFAQQNIAILTTVKDGVRFQEALDKHKDFSFDIYTLPVKPKFFEEDENSFNQLIINYVREGSGNS
jgi:tetraacyldisaccharide 4'-kinase